MHHGSYSGVAGTDFLLVVQYNVEFNYTGGSTVPTVEFLQLQHGSNNRDATTEFLLVVQYNIEFNYTGEIRFLSDPGKPGVRSMGPLVCPSQTETPL